MRIRAKYVISSILSSTVKYSLRTRLALLSLIDLNWLTHPKVEHYHKILDLETQYLNS